MDVEGSSTRDVPRRQAKPRPRQHRPRVQCISPSYPSLLLLDLILSVVVYKNTQEERKKVHAVPNERPTKRARTIPKGTLLSSYSFLNHCPPLPSLHLPVLIDSLRDHSWRPSSPIRLPK